jgi:GAF domain-containing protein
MASLTSVDSVLMVADIARTLNEFRPLEETLERICERVTGLSGYDFTALFMPDEQGQTLVIRGSWGLSASYIDYVNHGHPVLLDDTRQLGLAPAAEAYRSGHPMTLADVELEPSFQPWKPGARLQGYRSLSCIPVIVRSQAIGLLTCYGRDPRQPSRDELELLQVVARLAGVAIETARVAEGQRAAVDELRELTTRLRQQNEELLRLSAIQSRLAAELAAPDVAALERTAGTLAELTDRAVLVADPSGHAVVFAGSPGERGPMAEIAARRGLAGRMRLQSILTVDGHTCVRIGLADLPLGMIVLRPALEEERGTAAVAASHAAAVMAAELHSERADRALEMHARPAVLRALAHGLYQRAELREAAGVLGVPADAELRLVVLHCASSEAAHQLSRRTENLRDLDWPWVATTSDGRDTLLLLHPGEPSALRRTCAALREKHREIERIGVSGALRGLEAVASGRWQAAVAAGVDVGDSLSATLYEDLGALGELARDLPGGRVRGLVQQTLGGLRAYDEARGAELVRTLATYLRHQGRVRRAAAELGVHPNTVHQRLRRGAELGGFDLSDVSDLCRVVLALKWDHMLRAANGWEEDPVGGVEHV